VGKPPPELSRQAIRQDLDDLLSIGSPALAAQFLLNDPSANLKVGVDLNEVNATRHRSARPGDQFADVGNELGCELHSSDLTNG
jgi:hypothetical protein